MSSPRNPYVNTFAAGGPTPAFQPFKAGDGEILYSARGAHPDGGDDPYAPKPGPKPKGA